MKRFLILVVFLLSFSLMTFASYNGSGDISVGSGGTHNSTYSSQNQGLRFYIVNENGDIVSKVVDVTNGNPYTKVTDPYYFKLTTKRGLSTNGYYLEPDWNKYFSSMPLPVEWQGGSIYVGNGEEIKNYLMQVERNGLKKLENFINTENILGLAGVTTDKTATQVLEENQNEDGSGWRIMIEPVAWVVPRNMNGAQTLLLNGKPCWVYGTYTDFANVIMTDLDGVPTQGGNDYASILNVAGPKSMELTEDIIFANDSYIKKNIYGTGEVTTSVRQKRFSYRQVADTSNGLGIHSFKPSKNGDGIPSDIYHYEYRTNTEVITSVLVRASDEIDPDDEAYVTFEINGKSYNKQFVCPENSSQLVWVRWTTPDTPQDISISLSTTNGTLETNALNCKISDLVEKTPPDPTPLDRNDRFHFLIPPASNKSNISNSWSEWSAEWIPNWQFHPKYGWVDLGYWKFTERHYEASLVAKVDLIPASTVKTHRRKGNTWEMKSGYGVEVQVDSSENHNSSDYDVTGIQNAMSFFPEFKYKTYNRILEEVDGVFVYKDNEYSFADAHCHYTPLWYPDTTKYEVENVVFDMWTPAGQLWAYTSDYIFIEGNVYDDYDIVEVSPTDPDYPG